MPLKKIQTPATFLALFFISAFFLFQTTNAEYTHDDAQGYFNVNFLNTPNGIDTGSSNNIEIDTVAGIAQIETNPGLGDFLTTEMTPSSFEQWNNLIVQGTLNNPAAINASIYDCNGPSAINNYENLPITDGAIDLTNLDPITYDCIRVRIDLDSSLGSSIEPTVEDLTVNWTPKVELLSTLSLSAPPSVQAGDTILYTINYSVSYTDAEDLVIWAPLPSIQNNTITNYTDSYNQDLNPTFNQASHNGAYTNTEITINNQTIPANSVYWLLGNVPEGTTSLVNFTVQTNNGTENQVTYHTTSHINATNGTQQDSNNKETEINSNPSPGLNKTTIGTLNFNDINYVHNESPYSPIITYNIQAVNNFSPRGREEIFNPTITDDLSDIFNELQNRCSEPNPENLINVNQDGSLDVNSQTITWNLNNLEPGQSNQVSYEVDYSSCPESVIPDEYIIDNVAELTAENISAVTDQEQIVIGVDETPSGSFAKGDLVNNHRSIRADNDDHRTVVQNYNEIFSYLLYADNAGPVRMDDITMVDQLPDDFTLLNVFVPQEFNALVYYSTNDVSNEPTFDYTDPLANPDWTNNPADLAQVNWVAIHVPCLSSSYFDSPSGSQCENVPSQFTAQIQMQINDPVDQCSEYDRFNIATFNVNNVSDSISNEDADVVAIDPVDAASIDIVDTEPTHVGPMLANLSASSSLSGPLVVEGLEQAAYSLTVRNTGQDVAQDTRVTVEIPQIVANGSSSYLDLVRVTGGAVDYSNLPQSVIVDLGDIGVRASRTVSLIFQVPRGVLNNTTYTLNARITAEDPVDNCQPITASKKMVTRVTGLPELSVVKNRDESIIDSGGSIHYQLKYASQGTAPSQGTYIIDRIPNHTIFQEAYTSATDANNNTYTCNNCQVYFAQQDPDMPTDLTPLDPFDQTIINQFFTLGEEISPGIWESPFDEDTYYVAFLVDDKNIDLFPAGSSGMVGFSVVNDHDENGPSTDGSPVGTMIHNTTAIFSNELLQSITNQVITTILPDPGLRMDKTSDKEILTAGETFNWNIEYFNDSGNADETVIITDTLPSNIILNTVHHQWNQNTLDNDNSLSTGEQDITGQTTITYNPDGTTTVEIPITDLRGGDLQLLEGGTIRLAVQVGDTVASGTYLTNSAIGCFSNTSASYCLQTSDEVLVQNPDLWIRKLASRVDPIAGETLTYTLLVSNEGAHEATNVEISDTLPPELCFIDNSTQTGSTAWSIEDQPQITGGTGNNCGATLTWSQIDHTDFDTGIIPGNSEDIIITYQVQVEASTTAGTDLTNGATISTDLTEDGNYANDDNEQIATPLPDPYVFKYSPLTVLPGDFFSYQIQYGNSQRESTQNLYLLDTLPVDVDLKIISTVGTNNEEFYYHQDTNPTIVDITDITTNWTQDPTSITPKTIAIIPQAQLGELEGPYIVTVNVQAVDHNTDQLIDPGVHLDNQVDIYADIDDDDTNNQAISNTVTPGIDLAIEKTSPNEGTFPGIPPGADQEYTIIFSNEGTVNACAVNIIETLPAELTPNQTLTDFTYLQLTNKNGQAVYPIDTQGNQITSQVNITTVDNQDNSYTFFLGSSDTTEYTNVCLPPNSQGSFNIYATVNLDVPNETSIINTVTIQEDSDGDEDTLENNTDTSEATIYLADLTVSKEGSSCGPDDICGNSDDDSIQVNPGETIQYTIEYNNAGSIDAEYTTIQEQIPTGTCYKLNTVEVNQPAGSTIEYSNDDGITYSYAPTDGGDGTDCMVTNFRVVFPDGLPSPATFDGEGSGTFEGNYDTNELIVDERIELGKFAKLVTDQAGTEAMARFHNSMDYGEDERTILTDSQGNAHAVWVEDSAIVAENRDIYYYNGSTDQTVLLSDHSSSFYTSSYSADQFLIDDNDQVHILWREFNDVSTERFDVYYYNSNIGSTINISDLVNTEGDAGEVEAVLDDNNVLHAFWSETNSVGTEGGDLYYYSSDTDSTINISDQSITEGGISSVEAKKNTSGNIIVYWGEESAASPGEYDIFYYDSSVGTTNFISSQFDSWIDMYGRQSFIDDNDVWHITWYEQSGVGSESYDIFYYNSNIDNIVLLTDRALTEGAGSAPQMEVNSFLGVAHIAWSEISSIGAEGSDVFYYNSSTGSTSLISDHSVTASGLARDVSLTLDNSDVAHIAWVEASSTSGEGTDVFYYNSDAATTINITDQSITVGNADFDDNFSPVVIDDNGVVHIVWDEESAASDEYEDVYYYNSSTGNTILLTDHVNSRERATYQNLQVDSNNVVHVVWLEYSNIVDEEDDIFYYNSNTGETVLISDRAMTEGDAYGFSMKIDSASVAHISWGEYDSDFLKSSIYYYNSGSSETINISNINQTGNGGTFWPKATISQNDDFYAFWTQPSDIAGESYDAFVWPYPAIQGTYETTISTEGDLMSWDALQVNQEIPENTNIIYTILDSTCITPFAGLENLELTGGQVDISSIDIADTELCLRVELTAQNKGDTPYLNSWRASYITQGSPSFTFEAVANESQIESPFIDNTVGISTLTPELEYDNNTDSDQLQINLTDLEIEKEVDMNAASAGESITYTLSYANNGPRGAEDFLIEDFLPEYLDEPTNIVANNTSEGNSMECMYQASAHAVLCSNTASGTEYFDPNTLYAAESAVWGGDGNLRIVDQSTWADQTLIPLTTTDPIGPIGGVKGLTINPMDGVMWAIVYPSAAAYQSAGYLATIDLSNAPTEAAVSVIGQLTQRIAGIAFDDDGILYGITGSGGGGGTTPGTLFLMNKTDASLTEFMSAAELGSGNYDPSTEYNGGSIAYNWEDGYLYRVHGEERFFDAIELGSRTVINLGNLTGDAEPLSSFTYMGNGQFVGDSWCNIITFDTAGNVTDEGSGSCFHGMTFPQQRNLNISGSLAPQESGTITITAPINASAPAGELLLNNTSISSTTLDLNPDNNQDTASTIIGSYANVYINKEGPTFANLDQTITYTLNYGNNGNENAEDVIITDTIDSTNLNNISAVQATTDQGITFNCNYADPIVTCPQTGSITLPPGEFGTIEITATINNNTDLLVNNTVIPNTVTIETSTTQTNILDDQDSLETLITPNTLSVIQGQVFLDNNRNVKKEIDEEPIPNIYIFLAGVTIYNDILGPDPSIYPDQFNQLMEDLNIDIDPNNLPDNYQIINPAITDNNGEYSFSGLPPGDYRLLRQQRDGYELTGSTAGFTRYNDPTSILGLGSIQGAPSQDEIINITLGENQLTYANNFGEVPTSTPPTPVTPPNNNNEDDGDDDDDDDDDDDELSTTGTSILYYLLAGLVLIGGGGKSCRITYKKTAIKSS